MVGGGHGVIMGWLDVVLGLTVMEEWGNMAVGVRGVTGRGCRVAMGWLDMAMGWLATAMGWLVMAMGSPQGGWTWL